MKSTIWNAIICDTLKTEQDPDFVEACSVAATDLKAAGLSAGKIIECVCNILLKFPNFSSGLASDMSEGMLAQYGEYRPPLERTPVYSILHANLYCVLALEAIGQKIPNESFLSLVTLINNYPSSEYDEASRFLSESFPPELKELFAIEKKSEALKSSYQIGTQFPTLLLALLKNARISPLSSNPTTANSIKYSKKFYNECVQAIAPDGNWSERSFVEYYLFERIFRLDTKFTLFCEEYRTKNKSALSPQILADFFFHSPLVLFPQPKPKGKPASKLLHEFYKQIPDLDAYVPPMQFLHFLIQLSSVWFPQVLVILRAYMNDHNIKSFQDVSSFFFPMLKDFPEFQKEFTPSLDEFTMLYDKAKSEKEIPPGVIKDYSDRWYVFPLRKKKQKGEGEEEKGLDFQYCAKSFMPYSLDDWESKTISEYRKPQDRDAITEIQETLE